jgi:hypothetical protein
MAVLLMSVPGCGLIVPCTDRQGRGTVATIAGEVAAGSIASHRVSYETRGSQNDATISWADQSLAAGPRLRVYATRAACEDFQPPQSTSSGACAVLGSAGWSNGVIANTLILTHGRGNPEVLGSPAEYKLWVVGDPERNARYTIHITWFYGPDC